MAKKRPATPTPKPPQAVKRRVLKAAPKEPFPWWPFLLLVATLALFWYLPRRMGNPPVKVEFGQASR